MPPSSAAPSASRLLIACMAGTAIECFDLYLYATAAVLVFPTAFFPDAAPATALLESLGTFSLAFMARPLGSLVFGHFGDRHGRKATLVAALITMGAATVGIGLLPSYATIGVAAPILLALLRFGQGLGFGGEWSGAVLVATECAPPGRRAWYGMFPQLGSPLGFALSILLFLALASALSDAQFLAWGWRVPFVASAALIGLGLYVRLHLTETPAFAAALEAGLPRETPAASLLATHLPQLLAGTLVALMMFVLFYLTTVFSLSWGTAVLQFNRRDFLLMQLISVFGYLLALPLAAALCTRHGCRAVMIGAAVAIALFGLSFPLLFGARAPWPVGVFLVVGQALVGLSCAPLGTLLVELFPVSLRYTGSALSFNLAGILGASIAPYIVDAILPRWGLAGIGGYLFAAATLSLIALVWGTPRIPRH